MRIHVEPDSGSLGRRAANFVADVLLAMPNTALALPTGRTPLGMYRELARKYDEEGLDFSRARIFSLDEYRGVLPNDERSFDHYLRKHLLSRINVLPENVHLLSSAADGAACQEYETRIREAGGIDLLIAGVGTNGHIAFNEPGTPANSRTRVVDLAQSTLANMRSVFGEDELPRQAVSMGLGTILEARRILVLASGQTKQKALAGLLNGPVTIENPISAVRLHGDVTVIADQEAAGAKQIRMR